MSVNEQVLLEELQQIPRERWGEVLSFIRSLHLGEQPAGGASPIRSGTDLVGSDLVGIWADRPDIKDSREFARQLRRRAENRDEGADAAGYGCDG